MKGVDEIMSYEYDESIFNEKYEKYSKMIFRTAYQYLLNVDSAEDITQEAFVRLLTSNKVFNEEEHEKAWILRVTINLCKNALKSKHSNNVALNDEIEIADNSFEDNLISKIDMKKQIECLSPAQRTVIYLYYYERFSIKEIAKITQINQNTVKSHLKRAKENLKINIEKERTI